MRLPFAAKIVHLTSLAGLTFALGGCGMVAAQDSSVAEPEPTFPAELSRTDRAPDPEMLLPPLEGFIVVDDADSGEMEASLDHSSLRYDEVRRRLVLNDEGFAVGAVTVVTLTDAASVASAYVHHRFGDVSTSPELVAGVEMVRVEAEPYAALAWIGPAFVVTFERGEGMSTARLRELARTTVRAIAKS